MKNNDNKEELHNTYKVLRNDIVNQIRISKKNYYQQCFTENSKNMRKNWIGIKSIINIKSTVKGQPTAINVNDKLTSDPTIIANSFNKYFSSIAKTLQEKIHHNGEDFSKFLKHPNENNFFIKPTDQTEILFIIDSLQCNKATGPHSIPTDILQLIKFNICTPLCEIINLSFTTGIYPDQLKIAKIIPIHKEKGCKLQCNNYRPISLLSNINKIFEKLMHCRLYEFLNLHNCIYELQFGFRENHSTNHALLSLTENIQETLDNNKFAPT